MKVTEGTFFVVQTKKEDHIYSTEAEAINHLKSNASDVDPESDDIAIVEVSFTNEDWAIKELPWQRIALEIIKEN